MRGGGGGLHGQPARCEVHLGDAEALGPSGCGGDGSLTGASASMDQLRIGCTHALVTHTHTQMITNVHPLTTTGRNVPLVLFVENVFFILIGELYLLKTYLKYWDFENRPHHEPFHKLNSSNTKGSALKKPTLGSIIINNK